MTVRRGEPDRFLDRAYPFDVSADPDGGYVIVFPDLPGCMTQVEHSEEIGPMADEIRRLWIETEAGRGNEIPPPSVPEEYSGRFLLRIPRSLHRALAESAKREGVSLNQYAAMRLARGDAQAGIERRLDGLAERLGGLGDETDTLARGVGAEDSGGRLVGGESLRVGAAKLAAHGGRRRRDDGGG